MLWCSVAALLDTKVASLVQRVDAPGTTAPEAGRGAILPAPQVQARQDGSIVVVVDEAQGLRRSDLEELRSLAEAGTTSGARVAVLVAGQPELDLMLATLSDERRTPANTCRVELARLNASEVDPYVAYRLRLAGAHQDEVFEPDAIERIAGYAEGIPRVINQLCDAALRIAEQAGVPVVSVSIVDRAARQLALPFPGRAAIRGARYAPRGAPSARARLARPGHSKVRTWLTGASVAALVLVAAVLFESRRTSHLPSPPPPPEVAAPVQAEAPQRPPVTAVPEGQTPAETPRVTPPTPPTAAEQPRETPMASGPNPARQPSQRVDRRGATPSPLTSRGPARSAARKASPMALALLDNAEAGNLAEMRGLLAAGISPDAADTTGITPLMLAVIHNHGAVAELLLARGADVNASDNGGVTALMLAASNGRTALLQRLVNRGANINARSDAGWTPLTYAAWNGHAPAVRRLLEAGADPHLTDRIGWTALQYARWRAADPSRTRHPDAADLPPPENAEPADVAQQRHTETVNILNEAARKR